MPSTFSLPPRDSSTIPRPLSPPTSFNIAARNAQIEDLRLFLITAPRRWDASEVLRRYQLPTGEHISCVCWHGLFHITGTDIVRSLIFRFNCFGRPVHNLKKFEEGVFSDLRNLKPGVHASLEEPKSEFLELLHKNSCIRTQKKQKVFFWYTVPHDRLFLDALERDLRKERTNAEPTSVAVAEPALSFGCDAPQEAFDKFRRTLTLRAGGESEPSSPVLECNTVNCNDTSMLRYPATGDEIGMFGQREGLVNSIATENYDTDLECAWAGKSATSRVSRPIAYPLYQSSSSFGPVRADMFASRLLESSDSLYRTKQQKSRLSTTFHLNVKSSSAASMHQTQGSVPSPNPVPLGSVLPTPDEHLFNVTPMPITPNFPTQTRSTPIFPTKTRSTPIFPIQTRSPQIFPTPTRSTPILSTRTARPSLMACPSLMARPSSQSSSLAQPNYPLSQSDFSTTSLSAPSTSAISSPFVALSFSAAYSSCAASSSATSLSAAPSPCAAPPACSSPLPSSSATSSPFAAISPLFGMFPGPPTPRPLDRFAHARSVSPNATAPIPSVLHSTPSPSTSHSDVFKKRFYVCPFYGCDRHFKRLEHRKRHLRTHTSEKPYGCHLCGKKFSRTDNLSQHRKTHERRSECETERERRATSGRSPPWAPTPTNSALIGDTTVGPVTADDNEIERGFAQHDVYMSGAEDNADSAFHSYNSGSTLLPDSDYYSHDDGCSTPSLSTTSFDTTTLQAPEFTTLFAPINQFGFASAAGSPTRHPLDIGKSSLSHESLVTETEFIHTTPIQLTAPYYPEFNMNYLGTYCDMLYNYGFVPQTRVVDQGAL
ncbi:STE like transcription factor-domain-containing protein [Endogone sp. FLAS-F59071]|nr:STE like transcription factor-domain-containing protein [Endogone sp. FLAS-F59071]|eukprot:RUS19893.1 STE like transcription factor-domain-containing protein [Endogone sp. FLAS-F59071]